MQGALSNPTRWAGTRQGRLEGEVGEGKCLTRFSQLSLRHLPSAKKQNPPTQPAGLDPKRRAYRGPRRARERGEHRAPSTPGGDQPARPPAPLPAPARPHARTSPTSRGRLPWRQAASPEAALNGCRSQSTTPRRGTSSPPAAPGSPATPPVSREAGGRERARGRGRRKGGAANGGGHLCAASGGVAAIVLRRRLLCCPRGLRPSTPGEEEEEAVWLR